MRKIVLAVFILIALGALFFVSEKREIKILFVGDMMFDRYIRQVSYAKDGDYIFSCISEFLKDADLVVGNLEGPITENASRSLFTEPGSPGNYTFTFPTYTAKLLAKNNIKLVNLGNNHIGNFGEAGIDSTKNYLNKAGVNYFGEEQIYKKESISFISYNEFSDISAEKAAQKIKEEKEKGQFIIVYAHWGDEYMPPPERVKRLARLFVDAGAYMIIGSHPHIVQEKEVYKNKPIYYSLGNFIFDQYWNEEVSTGLVLELNIKGKDVSDWKIIEHKVSLEKDGRTCLIF